MNEKVSMKSEFLKRIPIRLHLLLVLGILVVAIGIVCAVYRLPQKFMNLQIRKTLTVSPESPIYQEWKDPSIPIYMKFYLFNVTNGKKIIEGDKPHLNELGPYVYRMYTPKFNVTFYDNGTVSFFNNHTLIFEPDMSNGSEYDIVNHLNVPLVTLGIKIKELPPALTYFGFIESMVNMVGGQHLFIPHTVKEILFGYRDPIMSMLSGFLSFSGVEIDPFFGFFRKFNNSDDGSYLTYTGEKNYKKAHQISKWNGKRYLDKWTTKYANIINGSDGSFLGFNLSPDDTPYIYFSQMFRSMKLEYEKESEVQGIKTLQFHMSDDLLTNATIEPDNAGFCVPVGNCFDSGVLNVQAFMDGAPGIISLPHFYNAAEQYQNSVLGMLPDKEKHDSIFHVEPLSGAVFLGVRRLQVNILVHPTNEFKQLNHVRKTIFPVVWMSGSAEFGSSTVNQFKVVLGVVKFMGFASYIIIATGCLILFFSLLCYSRPHLVSNKHCGFISASHIKFTTGKAQTNIEPTNEKETTI